MKLIFTTLLTFLAFSAFSQIGKTTTVADKLVIRDSLVFDTITIDGISVDDEFQNASHRKLPTQKAVKDYVEQNSGGGLTIHGTYKNYAAAIAAGIQNGDYFLTDPKGVFGCAYCIRKYVQ